MSSKYSFILSPSSIDFLFSPSRFKPGTSKFRISLITNFNLCVDPITFMYFGVEYIKMLDFRPIHLLQFCACKQIMQSLKLSIQSLLLLFMAHLLCRKSQIPEPNPIQVSLSIKFYLRSCEAFLLVQNLPRCIQSECFKCAKHNFRHAGNFI